MYKLIAIDLDGTLLDSRHRLSSANAEAVRACITRGCRVVLASGRLAGSLRGYARALGLDGPQIVVNGAALVDSGSGAVLSSAPLGQTQVRNISLTLMAAGIPFCYFTADAIYTLPEQPGLELLEEYGEPAPVPIESPDAVPGILKVLSLLPPGPEDERMRSQLGASVEVVRTGPPFLEFLRLGVNKGTMLATLMQRWGITPGQTLAIGDSPNDLSMFAIAGFSIAMAHADPVVRTHADAVTLTNDDDGVAVALHRWVLTTRSG